MSRTAPQRQAQVAAVVLRGRDTSTHISEGETMQESLTPPFFQLHHAKFMLSDEDLLILETDIPYLGWNRFAKGSLNGFTKSSLPSFSRCRALFLVLYFFLL